MKTRLDVSRTQIKHIIIFVSLTTIIVLVYILLNVYITQQREMKILNKEYYSTNEFVKTIDCAPIIDEYGCDNTYLLSFDLMSTKTGNILVYFQNGSDSRYKFQTTVFSVENQYIHYEIEVIPSIRDLNINESYLAFYGEYGSGVNPHVMHIQFEPIIG